jgi:probable F420-dependent oxidoreductase
MRLGICLPHYGVTMEADRSRQFAERVEALGFDSIWVTDHVIVPKSLSIVYQESMLDPLATLSYLAGVTSRLSLGTSVIILPYRNPITVAKEVASADLLSDGRVIFGAAAGWMEGEFRALNADFKNRGAVSDEYLQVIRELWTNPEPAFQGDRIHLSDVVFSPQPAQKPHPPIWIGGRSRRAIRRAVELGDGWHPNMLSYEEMQQSVEYMNRLSSSRGRQVPPALSARAGVDFDGRPGESRAALVGSGQEMAETLRRQESLGVDHVIASFPEVPMDQALELLERFAAEVLPAVR